MTTAELKNKFPQAYAQILSEGMQEGAMKVRTQVSGILTAHSANPVQAKIEVAQLLATGDGELGPVAAAMKVKQAFAAMSGCDEYDLDAFKKEVKDNLKNMTHLGY